MFDNYLRVIKRADEFALGIGKCRIETADNPIFLFTTLRILRITSGSGIWRVGARELHIKKGDIVFVNNVEPRQFIKIFDSPIEADVFALSPSLLSLETSLFSLFYGDIPTPVIDNCSELGKTADMLLTNILELSLKENKDISASAIHLILSAACLIKARIGDNSNEPRKARSKDGAYLIARAIAIISKELADIEDVSDIAKRVGLCREHFTVLFKRYAGTPPALYLRRARLERTIYLLKSEGVSVLDAALASGFSSSSGFYRAFGAEFKDSPRSFLK